MRRFSARAIGLAILFVAIVARAGVGQQPQAPAVTTHMVAMRDGVKLAREGNPEKEIRVMQNCFQMQERAGAGTLADT